MVNVNTEEIFKIANSAKKEINSEIRELKNYVNEEEEINHLKGMLAGIDFVLCLIQNRIGDDK